HVEGAVVLLGAAVVVARGQQVFGIDVPIDFAEQGLGVVGALDGALLAGVVEARRKDIDQGRVNAIRLFAVAGVLIVGDKEERPVTFDGAAEAAAELVLAEVVCRQLGFDGIGIL